MQYNNDLIIEILYNILHKQANNKKMLCHKYNITEDEYHELYEVLVDNRFILNVKAVKSGNKISHFTSGNAELSESGIQLLIKLQSKK